ncbi:MAG: hypothetical protein QOF56_1091, partial [Acidobacteriaceae bacterium]|nr:hypothetical protein [Acidobacteriaceae bacterium]
MGRTGARRRKEFPLQPDELVQRLRKKRASQLDCFPVVIDYGIFICLEADHPNNKHSDWERLESFAPALDLESAAHNEAPSQSGLRLSSSAPPVARL